MTITEEELKAHKKLRDELDPIVAQSTPATQETYRMMSYDQMAKLKTILKPRQVKMALEDIPDMRKHVHIGDVARWSKTSPRHYNRIRHYTIDPHYYRKSLEAISEAPDSPFAKRSSGKSFDAYVKSYEIPALEAILKPAVDQALSVENNPEAKDKIEKLQELNKKEGASLSKERIALEREIIKGYINANPQAVDESLDADYQKYTPQKMQPLDAEQKNAQLPSPELEQLLKHEGKALQAALSNYDGGTHLKKPEASKGLAI